MKKSLLFFVLIFFGWASGTFAQELKKGYLKYEVTDFKTDANADPQMSMAEGMLKGTITKVYFEGLKSLTKITSMGGMSNIKIFNDGSGNTDMYMDMMGQKILTKMSKEDIEKAQTENKPKMEYVHHKDQTKKILGYNTHLVEVKMNEQKDMEIKMTFWVTDEIKTSATVSQGFENDEIGGFPLEYTMSIPNQFSMTTACTALEKEFDASIFDFDKKGYKEMNMDDLKNMGSFGF